jgi:hypothetical protein
MEWMPEAKYEPKEEYITVVRDACTDLKKDQIFPDVMIRMALARNIAFYYTGSNKTDNFNAIVSLLKRIATNAERTTTAAAIEQIIDVVDGRITFKWPLKIKAIDFKDLENWHRMERLMAESA